MTPLRQRLVDELTRRNYSPRTVEAYVAAVARTARHFACSPDRLTPDQLRDFQLHLIARAASWSLFNQVACALRFFYRHVLDRPDFVPFVVYGKKPRSLPVVLGPADVRRLLDAVPAGRNRLMLRIAYGCGLRVSELTHLRVADIDGARNILWVRAARGTRTAACRCRRCCSTSCGTTGPSTARRTGCSRVPRVSPWTSRTLQRAFQLAPERPGCGNRRRPHPAALLRHAPARSRHRPADVAAPARPQPPLDHTAVPAPAERPPAAHPIPVGIAGPIGYTLGRWNDRASNWRTWCGRAATGCRSERG